MDHGEVSPDALVAEIEQFAAAAADVLPSGVVAALRRHSFLGVTAPEAAASLAAEVQLPARLYATLMRIAQAALPQPVVALDTSTTVGDSDDLEPKEPGWDADGLEVFLNKAAKHQVLTFEQEQDLGKTMDEGRIAQRLLDEGAPLAHQPHLRRVVRAGRHAEDEMARHNIRLVVSMAYRLRARCTPSFALEDLIEEGYFGLARAVQKWDYARGLKFSTYATWWIRQCMERALDNQAQLIRIPVHMHDRLTALWRIERGSAVAGQSLDEEHIAERLGITVGQLAETRQFIRTFLSLDMPVGGSKVALGQLLPDPNQLGNPEAFDMLLDRSVIDGLLEHLTARQIEVLTMRFGLDGGERHTLEAVGEQLGFTRERARQIQVKAIKQLRHLVLSGEAGDDLRDDLARRLSDDEEEGADT